MMAIREVSPQLAQDTEPRALPAEEACVTEGAERVQWAQALFSRIKEKTRPQFYRQAFYCCLYIVTCMTDDQPPSPLEYILEKDLVITPQQFQLNQLRIMQMVDFNIFV